LGCVLPEAIRSRDAGRTRQLLLGAARVRFARDGYAATTVRDIAADAEVNVALINRYFTSKEGLFEACLVHTVEELDPAGREPPTFACMLQNLVKQVVSLPSGEHQQLLLLLRSSGDEQAHRIRRSTLHSYAERMARIVGWEPGNANSEELMLNAQIAVATAFGIVMLRSSAGIEPLASATEEDLAFPLHQVFATLLSLPPGDPSRGE
jgi:AcrR family transcriptional regulator